MRPELATALEELRHRAAGVANPMDDEGGQYGNFESAFLAGRAPARRRDPATPVLGKPGEIARLQVQTRAADSPVALKVPDTATAGQPFTVASAIHQPDPQDPRPRQRLRSARAADAAGRVPRAQGRSGRDRGLDPHHRPQAPQGTARSSSASPPRPAARSGSTPRPTCETETEWQACQEISDGQLDAVDIAPGDGATHTAITAGADGLIRGAHAVRRRPVTAVRPALRILAGVALAAASRPTPRW